MSCWLCDQHRWYGKLSDHLQHIAWIWIRQCQYLPPPVFHAWCIQITWWCQDMEMISNYWPFVRGIHQSLTQWGRDKMHAILQTTFSSAFSWMKNFDFQLKFHWSLFLRVQLTIFQHWFRWWLGAVQATSHYLKQWWLIYRRIYASLGLNELMNSSYKGSVLQSF